MSGRIACTMMCLTVSMAAAQPPRALPLNVRVEENPTDATKSKIVFIAGTNYYKPGEHEYVGGCAVLMDLVKQTPGIAPVLALDWPKKPETLAGAKAIVLLFDGAEKHEVLKQNRATELQKLLDSGTGLVQLHQTADYPKAFGDRARAWAGGAWEKGKSQRAHWVATFDSFPKHPVFQGVTKFTIDDGWLWNHHFVDSMTGVTPLLRTVNPKSKDDPKADAAVIAWAYDRPGGGRTVTFTGGHLHKSFEEEGYRRFLVNSIVWSAGLTVPENGCPVKLDPDSLPRYLTPAPAKK